jgi:general secretion pathway protein E
VLNDEIRELIVSREPIRRVKEAARRVRAGESTLQEINRVTLVA